MRAQVGGHMFLQQKQHLDGLLAAQQALSAGLTTPKYRRSGSRCGRDMTM